MFSMFVPKHISCGFSSCSSHGQFLNSACKARCHCPNAERNEELQFDRPESIGRGGGCCGAWKREWGHDYKIGLQDGCSRPRSRGQMPPVCFSFRGRKRRESDQSDLKWNRECLRGTSCHRDLLRVMWRLCFLYSTCCAVRQFIGRFLSKRGLLKGYWSNLMAETLSTLSFIHRFIHSFWACPVGAWVCIECRAVVVFAQVETEISWVRQPLNR